MMAVLFAAVFAAAGVAAIAAIALAIGPQWRRILRLAAGRIEPAAPVARWRSVHLAADRRRPFQQARGDASRRGLLGRLVRR